MSEILERPQPMPAFGMRTTEEWNVQDYLATKLLSHDFLTKAQALDSVAIGERIDQVDDFKWYASGQLDTTSFKGKYIAIWKRQVAGVGGTALEAERIAKSHFGENCSPAVVFIPADENAIL